MEGYSRHLFADFKSYNDQATVKVKFATQDNTIIQYTYALPDLDPLYCWAREEAVYTDLMSVAELAKVEQKDRVDIASMEPELSYIKGQKNYLLRRGNVQLITENAYLTVTLKDGLLLASYGIKTNDVIDWQPSIVISKHLVVDYDFAVQTIYPTDAGSNIPNSAMVVYTTVGLGCYAITVNILDGVTVDLSLTTFSNGNDYIQKGSISVKQWILSDTSLLCYVTHDVEEALYSSSQVAFLSGEQDIYFGNQSTQKLHYLEHNCSSIAGAPISQEEAIVFTTGNQCLATYIYRIGTFKNIIAEGAGSRFKWDTDASSLILECNSVGNNAVEVIYQNSKGVQKKTITYSNGALS